ncbi:hypothetical protein PHSY_006841 [Pseudozyma hubeiensis SY62]|uniref:Mitochondrial pyruvate carrier n=1 Tax=Pseudozyma hubeiensis (strain SY62) TaxID=1305764 RepID=R9PD09_PSEHS|nr:hypothetical protein PHSY_006841 [Pseudozyma hubeiensis SY62]GAC99241.1 hypothetical protein PHSY_006841 [Pseudozyma hubeiensis SY62]
MRRTMAILRDCSEEISHLSTATQNSYLANMASAAGSKFQSFMNHPAGPKTVFFWAPLMKWCLVAAGLKDLSRPADKISVPQNVALAATGMIWVRYSLVITPVNYSLAAVNFFVGCSGLAQLYRVWDFRRQHPVQAAVADKKNEVEGKISKENLPMTTK